MTRTHARLAAVVSLALATLIALASAQADTPAFDCAKITIDSLSYDISALKTSTIIVQGEPKEEYPSTIRVDYMVNPCQAIPIPDGELKTHCKAGAWVCQDIKVIEDDKPKTLFLKTIAGSAAATDTTPARDVAPTAARTQGSKDEKDLPWSLTLKGGNIDGRDQSAVINFVCDRSVTDAKQGLALDKYDSDVVHFTWKSNYACASKDVQLPTSEGMSGFRVFLTVFGVLGFIYIVAGAAYNYKTYGARGLDLLPNLDFWRDFPSLVSDVVRSVWDSVTGRATSSRGYVSV
ncbi:hypothetical protein BGZ75_000339 [Mortierella antarctica]|nr:hypothetical protein BGZ67_001386 [Mortierella alpina]KAF9987630.1 hypothetical protein BGZ75_000339 [Mortierella antarctica]